MPAPSVGALFGMILFPDTGLGRVLFGVSKIWLIAVPVLWLKFVEKRAFSLSPARQGGFRVGIVSGVLISGAIIGLYLLAGDQVVDRAFFIDKLRAIGLGSWPMYLGGTAYWVLINSVLEE